MCVACLEVYADRRLISFCLLSVSVFSSLTVSLERDEIQLSTPLSLSLPHLLYQFPVPVEATNVSAICVGANSLVIVICVSLLLALLLLLLLRKS